MHQTANLFLNALPLREREALAPHLKACNFTQRTVLFDPDQPVLSVHFPFDAIISVVVPLSGGAGVEAAMIGRDGVVAAGEALNGGIAINRAVVQLGGTGFSCPAEALASVATSYPPLRSWLMHHEQALMVQAQQAAACNVSHSVEQRLARWLLRARDLASDDLRLTQEYIAEMLGVRRSSVSQVANALQQAGLIRYNRGRINIRDTAGLHRISCECYDVIRSHYQRLTRRDAQASPLALL